MRRSSLTANAQGLYPREVKFVKEYTNPDSPNYLNGTGSYNAISPSTKRKPNTARRNAYTLMHRPAVEESIRERLNQPDIDEMLDKGVRKRLADPDKKGWQETADFVAKVRGDFAPEKHLNMEMNKEDRDQIYAEIMDKIRYAQKA